MSATPNLAARRSDLPACKIIFCVLPDDGTARRLLIELRQKHGVIRAGSNTCRGIGALGAVKTKHGKLPEADLVKKVHVICAEDQADAIFDFIFWSANIDKPSRGSMWQQPLTACTAYELPADIPDEETGA